MTTFPPIGATNISMRLRRANAVASSPFTYAQQVYQHQGTRWEMEMSLPTLNYNQAREVEAFLINTRGQAETFFAGNPLHTSAAVVSLSALTATRDTVLQCEGNEVHAGTYFQLGDHLYMCTDYFSGSGKMQIEPPMRESLSLLNAFDCGLITDTATTSEDRGWVFQTVQETVDFGFVSEAVGNRVLNFLNPKCLWRMASNDTGWTTDVASMHEFTFAFVEAL
tara:strand:+ start:184 stop:852 length:669 start_codon:yes stop_codon:yes gene_type:complete